jgi:hypothetical protein
MQSPVIRRRSVFFQNPRGGKQEKFDIIVAVSRHAGEADSSQAAEETIKEFSEIFEELVVSGKIPVNNPRVLTDNGSQGRSARSSAVSVITGKPVLQGKGNDL